MLIKNANLIFVVAALFASGCAVVDEKSEVKPLLNVRITHTGPQIDLAHIRTHRLTNSDVVEASKQPRTLSFSSAGGVICEQEENCRQFLQDSKFVVSAESEKEALVSWQIFTGREVVEYSESVTTKNYLKKSISPNIPSVPDSHNVINTVVRIGEYKEVHGPYGSKIIIHVLKHEY